MYIGIVGPYSTGKTTNTLKMLDVEEVHDGLTIVNCDNCRESWREWRDGEGYVINEWKLKAWQGSVTEKHVEITAAADAIDLFICETAWTDHITGVWKYLQNDGNPDNIVDFIVLTVEPDVFRRFIQARCELKKKPFRADYWDDKRLLYEGMNRPLNAANKYLTDINWKHYVIDEERKVWDEISKRLWDDVRSVL